MGPFVKYWAIWRERLFNLSVFSIFNEFSFLAYFWNNRDIFLGLSLERFKEEDIFFLGFHFGIPISTYSWSVKLSKKHWARGCSRMYSLSNLLLIWKWDFSIIWEGLIAIILILKSVYVSENEWRDTLSPPSVEYAR